MADVYTRETGTPVYDSLLVKFVRNKLLETIRAGLVNGPAGVIDASNSYASGHTDEWVYPGIADLTVALNELNADEVTPPAIEQLESFLISFTTKEYARSIGWTSRLQRMSPVPIPQTVAERVSWNVTESFDEVLRLAWVAAAAGEKTVGAAGTALTTAQLLEAVTYLRSVDVPPLPSGYYAYLTCPEVVRDLKVEVGERSWNAAQLEDPANLVSGSVGRWQGVEFFVSSRNAPPSGTQVTGILTGANAMAAADTGSIQTFTVLPTASLVDPIAMRGVSSWRARFGATKIGRKRRQGDTALVYNHVRMLTKYTPVVVT